MVMDVTWISRPASSIAISRFSELDCVPAVFTATLKPAAGSEVHLTDASARVVSSADGPKTMTKDNDYAPRRFSRCAPAACRRPASGCRHLHDRACLCGGLPGRAGGARAGAAGGDPADNEDPGGGS